MTSAAVLIALGAGASPRALRPRIAAAASAALSARADELVCIVDDAAYASALPEEATVLLDEAESADVAGALRVASDWCARVGHEAFVAGILRPRAADSPAVADASAWARLAAVHRAPIALGELRGTFASLFRLDVLAWPLLPLEGNLEAALRSHGGLLEVVDLDATAPVEAPAPESDRAAVERLLGRAPQGPFRVVVRDRAGAPVVIENAPFLDDGTPMPTMYWLVGATEREVVGRLEAAGGVRRLEGLVDPDVLARAHARYAALRAARIPKDHPGPRPSGGVGGTREGVKCLHAHLAWYLAGGGDPVGAIVARELGTEISGAVAAIDCGTNSTRLLIVDAAGAMLERETTITRLGEGVDETGRLAPAAIERTIAALRGYRVLMDRHGVVRARCATTSAARDAENADELVDAIADVIGVRAEILSGDEEGRTAFAGATSDLDGALGPFVICDLGGGSTELVADGDAGIELVSLAMGCVRVRERFLHSDPPLPAELDAARAYVRGLLEDASAARPGFAAARTMVGVAGTVSTLALVASGADHYAFGAAHHLTLMREQVQRLALAFTTMPLSDRAETPGIEEGRADVIGAGALVLQEVMEVLDFSELTCSETDILDGLAMGLLQPASS